MAVEFIGYEGADFNGIFDGLDSGAYDCVTAGTTVTPEREKKAAFVAPYLISGQALAVDVNRLPRVHSIDDLEGMTIGVQQGNTSQPIAEELVAQGKAANVRVYDYGSIHTALTDLTTGGCDAVMKLAPVLTELVKPIAGVDVVQRGHLHREHRDRRRAHEPEAAQQDHRRADRAGGGRHAAADPAEMAGQSVRRSEPGRPLTSPRDASTTPLGWPSEQFISDQGRHT